MSLEANFLQTETQTKNNGSEEPNVHIDRLYLKDLSFESPKSPGIFFTEWKPQVELNLSTQAEALDAQVYEVILHMTVQVKSPENDIIFLVEVKQAGIFSFKNLSETQLGSVLNVFCPTVLYPYAREVVSSVANKGGFPQLNLAPINFDILLRQQQEHQSHSTH